MAAPRPEPTRGSRLAGHVALVLVQVCFGLFPVFGRWAFAEGGFTPYAVASWRVCAGALVLSLVAAARLGPRSVPRRPDLPRILACALFGVVLNQGLFLIGLERSTAVNAGLIMCLIPVFTFCLAAGAGQEAFRWVRAAGVAIALVGVMPLFFARGGSFLGDYRVGNLLMAINTLSYSVYLVISRPLARRHASVAVIAWVYVGALPSLLFFAWGESLLPAQVGSPRAWGSLAYILVFPTILGYLLSVFALARVRASTAAFYVYLQPLITGAASHFLLDEPWTPGTVPAAASLFVGVWLVTRRPDVPAGLARPSTLPSRSLE